MGHREQLLAAARRLLEDKGYAHITARDLVAASETNLASIGYHFGSKAGLLNAALEQVLQDWTTQLATAVMADPNATPIERTHLTWTSLLESLTGKRALLVSFAEAMAQADRDPALREQLAGMYGNVRRRVATMVATALGGEVTPDDPRATAVASWVIAVCDGLAMQWLLDPASSPTGEDLSRGLAGLRAASR